MTMNVPSRSSMSFNGAAVPSASSSLHVGDLSVAGRAAVEDRPNQVREVADAEADVDDPRFLELADDDLEDRLLAHRHQRLGQDRGVRGQTRAAPAGQHDRLHVPQAAGAVRTGARSFGGLACAAWSSKVSDIVA